MTQPTEPPQPDEPIPPQADEAGPAQPDGSDRGQEPHVEYVGGWRRLIAAADFAGEAGHAGSMLARRPA